MINELQKRPFARPLLIWIGGILLYSFFSYPLLAGIACVLSLGLLVASLYVYQRSDYSGRWMWGATFLWLLLALSVLVTGYAEKRLGQPRSVGAWERQAQIQQQKLVETFDRLRLNDSGKNVLATLTLGYRQAMDREMNRQFIATGVVHILSVSGYHIMVACGFISLLLGFIPRNGWGNRIRNPLMIILLWWYVWITGLSIPAVRAGLMMTFFLLGGILNRDGDRYNTLAASAFCMLVYQPFWLFDIGFQLSYVAVWFLLYLQPRLNSLIDVRNPLLATPWGWVTTTVAAQVGTTFLCLYYFGQFSTVFLLTNLPLTLISGLLIPCGLLFSLLPPVCPGYGMLQGIVEESVRGMLWIVERFSAFPLAVVTFDFGFLSLLVGYTLLFLFLGYHKRRPWMLLLALTLCFIWLLTLLVLKKC